MKKIHSLIVFSFMLLLGACTEIKQQNVPLPAKSPLALKPITFPPVSISLPEWSVIEQITSPGSGKYTVMSATESKKFITLHWNAGEENSELMIKVMQAMIKKVMLAFDSQFSLKPAEKITVGEQSGFLLKAKASTHMQVIGWNCFNQTNLFLLFASEKNMDGYVDETAASVHCRNVSIEPKYLDFTPPENYVLFKSPSEKRWVNQAEDSIFLVTSAVPSKLTPHTYKLVVDELFKLFKLDMQTEDISPLGEAIIISKHSGRSNSQQKALSMTRYCSKEGVSFFGLWLGTKADYRPEAASRLLEARCPN